MRVIEQAMIQAIRAQKDWHKDNTSVEVIHHGITGTPSYQKEIQVRLHDNLIARIFPGDRMILSACGWDSKTTAWANSLTTRSRLNAILHYFSLSGIYQKNWTWYIDGKHFEDGMEFTIH